MVVDRVLLERDDVGTVQAVRRLAPEDRDRALKEAKPGRAGDRRRDVVDRPLQHLALGREPEAVVDERRVAWHQILAQAQDLAIERDRFDRRARRVEHAAAGRLVDAARLHANVAVLDEVDPAYAVLAGDLVTLLSKLNQIELVAIDRDGVALDVLDLDHPRLVRRLARIARALEHLRIGFLPRILEDAALVARVEQVAIDGVRLVGCRLDRDRVRLRIFDQLLAALELPLAPRRDDLDPGTEVIRGELEPDLVVALARRAVRDRVRALGRGGLHQAAPDARSRERRAEQVLAFVQRAGAERGPHVVLDALVAEVAHDRLLRADGERLLARGLEVFVLADVGAEAYDLAVVALDDPPHRDAGVEATGVGQHHLANVRHGGDANAGCRAGTAGTGDDTPRASACPRRRGSRRSTRCRRSATIRTPRAG